MRLILIFLPLLMATNVLAQGKYYTRSGHIWFFSHTEIEDIEAHNHQATALLNPDMSVAVSLLQKSFKFPIALMQEHFNENYVESNKFPRATFNGKLSNFDFNATGKQNATVKGELSMHGAVQKISGPITMRVDGDHVYAKMVFAIDPKDYGIKIPTTVAGKIAESIAVHVELDLVAQ